MNFLANENFPRPSFLLLREHHHHVISISEIYAGIADEEVIKIAVEQNLIILTFDKDYGEIIFRYKYPKPPSVVYFKFKGSDPLYAGNTLLKNIEQLLALENHFTIIDDKNIRHRKYK
jgi:predicted nuclease of predicted toxin-antitoxin system